MALEVNVTFNLFSVEFQKHRVKTSLQFSLTAEIAQTYLPSAETVRDVLFYTKTTVLDKWLPVEADRIILHPAENFGRKQDDADSLNRKQRKAKKRSAYALPPAS